MPSGCKQDFIDSFFTGTSTQVEGVGLAEIATETVARHRMAFPMRRSIATPSMSAATMRSASAVNHTSGNLKSVADLQHAVRGNIPEKYRAFARQVNDQATQLMTLRGLFRLRPAEEMGRNRCRLKRLNRLQTSSGGLPPGQCRMARSAVKPTPRWPWP